MNDNNNINWINNQSNTFDFLRFPLSIFVVLIHWGSYYSDKGYFVENFIFFTDQGLSQFLCFTISEGIARIAVPMFYIISGYLFFYNFQIFTMQNYLKKIKSRIKTLVIPYIIWNTIVLIIYIISIKYGFIRNDSDFNNNFYNNPLTYLYNLHDINGISPKPINAPLWFVRDLIIVIVLSPIIYYFIKITNFFGILILFGLYFFNLWPNIIGFSNIAISYFSLGAYFSLNKLNIIQLSRKFKIIIMPIFIISYILVIYNHYVHISINWLFCIFIISAIFTMFAISSYLVERKNIFPSNFLKSSCFFIFASHTIFISVIKRFNYYPIPNTIIYILIPTILICILLCLYKLLSKYLPNLTKILSGYR